MDLCSISLLLTVQSVNIAVKSLISASECFWMRVGIEDNSLSVILEAELCGVYGSSESDSTHVLGVSKKYFLSNL